MLSSQVDGAPYEGDWVLDGGVCELGADRRRWRWLRWADFLSSGDSGRRGRIGEVDIVAGGR